MKVQRRNRIARVLAFVPLAAGAVGLLLHCTIRDRVPVLAVLFYGLAPVVVVVLLAVSCVLCLRLRRGRWAIVSFAATLVAAVVWIQTDYVRGDPIEADGDFLRLVVWNLARPSNRDERFLATLKGVDGHIMVLVESGRESEHRRRFWQWHFPDHHVAVLERDITLLSRYPIIDTVVHVIGSYTRIAVCDLATPFGPMSVLAIDIDSTLTVSRRPAIDRIYEIARSKAGPVAILGDFNTPHTSVFFDDMYRSFQHAFKQSGDGWITTWPTFFPALALDHIWLSDDLVVACALTRWESCSDHALVMADVTLSRSPDEQDREGVPAL